MRIAIVTTDLEHASRGNQVTAFRWSKLLRELKHDVDVFSSFESDIKCDVLIAIHARKSYGSILRFSELYPKRPILVCLSGTDLQVDMLPHHEKGTDKQRINFRRAYVSCDRATRLVLLEPYSIKRLPTNLHGKTRVILQSAEPVEKSIAAQGKPTDSVQICQLAHLRPIKDPFRIVEAALQLPDSSSIQIIHAGQAMDEEQRMEASEYEKRCQRYKWLGGLTHDTAIKLLAQSHAAVLCSLAEGAPSVISEAVVNGVPFIGSRIDATIGLLGEDYPGLFDVGSTEELTDLLIRFENEPSFRDELTERIFSLSESFSGNREREAWSELLREL